MGDDMKNSYAALLKISQEINEVQEVNLLLVRIMDIAMSVLEAERGFVLLKSDSGERGFDMVTAGNINQEDVTSIRNLSSSVVNEVLDTAKPVLSFDALVDERFDQSESIVSQKIRSIACTPMTYKDELVGAIYMDSLTRSGKFNEESLAFLHAFAGQASIALENLRMIKELRSKTANLERQIKLNNVFPEIIGQSAEIQEILRTIGRVADSRPPVLIEGESGTGKELVARALHYNSSRRDKLFIPVSCVSLAETLLESELFGHKKGAFTGAYENKVGLFEEAEGGTIFLDEIGDINLNIQTKLLRVIQQKEIKRVGESKIRTVDVRIVSATNKDLWKEVQAKNFREDLYYRLNVLDIKMPPLRDRGNDVEILAQHFLKRFAAENGKFISGFKASALQVLREYTWPGNIRELENAVERAVIMAAEKEISPADLNLTRARVSNLVGRSLKDIEKAAVVETLELTGYHRTRAAEILGVSLRWLQYRIKAWGLDGKHG